MAIVGLDREQSFALLAEMTSTRNLLAYGLRVIRTAAFIETTRDPIFTMLSIGVEKLYKLTLGLVALDRGGTWPTRAEMMASGHKLGEMHHVVVAELRSRTANKSEYVRGLLAQVEADPVIPPTVAAFDVYGRSGRFYHLDLLGDAPRNWESPDAYWQRIEAAALTDPAVGAAYAAAMADISDGALWDAFLVALNGRIAASIEALWLMIAVCGRNHALGETGGVFGFEVHPDAVGRQ